MLNSLKEILWKQFGASIDMLRNAIAALPDDQWTNDRRSFYIAFHTVFFLDYYLTNSPSDFVPGLPFTLTDMNELPEHAIDDVIPDKMYGKAEILGYLSTAREKCRKVIGGLNENNLTSVWKDDENREFVLLELLIYNMRHVQHHAAQLNMILRQKIGDAPHWIGTADDELFQKNG
ncbi:MAG: DinB family protein [Gemmatimonadaceae bacterium]|nr:DinB family protein [Chitinophagaceae bacterium]